MANYTELDIFINHCCRLDWVQNHISHTRQLGMFIQQAYDARRCIGPGHLASSELHGVSLDWVEPVL
jgi:hypothetical protein